MAFDFKKSLIKVQGGRQYLPVSARIVWFREVHPDWAIVTEPLEINHEKQYAVFRATVFNADGKIMATGTKKEDVKGFGDYLEKSETGAVGRALALCGFGTQFSPELDEVNGQRYTDSPQPMGGGYRGGGGGYNNNNNNGGSGGYRGSNGSNYGGSRASEASAAPYQSRRPESITPTVPAPPPAPSKADAGDVVEDTIEDFSPLADDDDVFAQPISETTYANAPAAAVKSEARTDGPPACTGCGKALTKAQQELSTRTYGTALCPNCQRDKTRTGRAAVAEHG